MKRVTLFQKRRKHIIEIQKYLSETFIIQQDQKPWNIKIDVNNRYKYALCNTIDPILWPSQCKEEPTR